MGTSDGRRHHKRLDGQIHHMAGKPPRRQTSDRGLLPSHVPCVVQSFTCTFSLRKGHASRGIIMYGKAKIKRVTFPFLFPFQIQLITVFAVQFANAKALERKHKETIENETNDRGKG